MDENNSRVLYIDIKTNKEETERQFNAINKYLNKISESLNTISGQITGIFNKINSQVGAITKKMETSINSIMEKYRYFETFGEVPDVDFNKNIKKGHLKVYKSEEKNIQAAAEMSDEQYRATREKEIYIAEQRKQIDNEIKAKIQAEKAAKAAKETKNETKLITTNIKNATDVAKNGLKKTKAGVDKTGESVKKATKHTKNWGLSLAKLGIAVVALRRIGEQIARTVKVSGDWIENLNLFEVTFGKTYKEYLDWSVGFSKNLGFSVNQMAKFTGLFKQLSTSIGIASETGDKLSKTLTSIGTDITSFYNLRSVTQAMEKLQAGIFSGQTKPLRSIGIDVTYQSIDNLLKTNDALKQFNTTSKALDQSQKALARTILILQGARNSFGDAAKTINTLSNQIRVFQGSMENFKLAVGDLMAEPARKFITYVNGIVIALTDVIRIFKGLKTETGNPLPDDNPIGELNDELEETEGHLGLLDFDKFNVFKKGNAGGADAITQALTEELNKQMKEYESVKESMGAIENNAIKIAEKIKAWLAITKGENGELESSNELVQTIYDFAKSIAVAVKDILPSMIEIGKAMIPIGTTILEAIQPIIEPLKNTVITLAKSISTILKTLQPIIELLSQCLETVGPILETVNHIVDFVVGDITSGIERINIIVEPLKAVVEFIQKCMQSISDILHSIFNLDFSSLGKKLGDLWNWDNWKSPKEIGDYFSNLFKNGFWDGIGNLFKNGFWDRIGNLFKNGFWDGIGNLFGGGIKRIFGNRFADGGIPTMGSLFVAGEAGTEMVSNIGGQTNVINMDQLQQAVAKGMIMAIQATELNEKAQVDVRMDINPPEMARAINPYIKRDNARGGYR